MALHGTSYKRSSTLGDQLLILQQLLTQRSHRCQLSLKLTMCLIGRQRLEQIRQLNPMTHDLVGQQAHGRVDRRIAKLFTNRRLAHHLGDASIDQHVECHDVDQDGYVETVGGNSTASLSGVFLSMALSRVWACGGS